MIFSSLINKKPLQISVDSYNLLMHDRGGREIFKLYYCNKSSRCPPNFQIGALQALWDKAFPMKIKPTVCGEERQMYSLNELHWGTISKYDLKISQKKSCVMQKRGLPDQMANTLICSRWGKSFYCGLYRGFYCTAE